MTARFLNSLHRAFVVAACSLPACATHSRGPPPGAAPGPEPAASLSAPAATGASASSAIRLTPPATGQAALEVSVVGYGEQHGPFLVTVNDVEVGHAPVLLRVLPGDYEVLAVARGDRHFCRLEFRASVVLESARHRHLVFEPQGARIATDPNSPLQGMGAGLKQVLVAPGDAANAKRKATSLPPRCH